MSLDRNPMQVGFGRADVTPVGCVDMAGAPDGMRVSTGNLTPMYVDSIALRDAEGTMVLMITADSQFAGKVVCQQARQQLSQSLGIPTAAIAIASTHTHNAPHPGVEYPYKDQLIGGIVESGKKAVADLAPAKMYGTIVKTELLNFVRNYIMNDGSYGGTGYGDHSIGFKAHETDADSDLQLVKFVREGAKDIVISNFCAHPHRDYNTPEQYYKITANVPFIYRQILEKEWDCHAAYFTGASGNVNLNSRIEEENITANYEEQGTRLAQYALSAVDSFRQLSGGRVSYSETMLEVECNHSQEHLLPYAQKVIELYEQTGDKKQAKALAREYGMENQVHAAAVLRMAQMDKTDWMPVQCFRAGEFAFAAMPGEPYDTLGRIIKDGAGYAMTFIGYICNVATGYLPSAETFSHGGYGVYTCRYAPGTGELLAQAFIDGLQKLHEE